MKKVMQTLIVSLFFLSSTGFLSAATAAPLTQGDVLSTQVVNLAANLQGDNVFPPQDPPEDPDPHGNGGGIA
ncbi:hypothetical protein [Acanthopleuribacter pedis]|uniref:Secreted protein n=1 Tax=Acanthopleuribacter pedis TaxID=442870 RepID=A0A8J7Q3X9_9BACT|nr:hypothetical protein [Acanthopleuribacter pedis]MBO1317221.1 hypothetical protein [Acanthopleuribacter pedis]MBO1318527.1 hypothetical protein [Acanthopleuribacter pedis]